MCKISSFLLALLIGFLLPPRITLTAPHEGLFCILQNQKIGYINSRGEIIIAPQFDEGSDFSDGVAAVRVEGKWGYVNPSGKFVIPPTYEETQGWHFADGLACVVVDHKTGFIDKTGKMAIPLQYDGPANFSGGYAFVQWKGQSGYIGTDGKLIWKGYGRSFSEVLLPSKLRLAGASLMPKGNS